MPQAPSFHGGVTVTLLSFAKKSIELLFIVLLNLNDVSRDIYKVYVNSHVYLVF